VNAIIRRTIRYYLKGGGGPRCSQVVQMEYQMTQNQPTLNQLNLIVRDMDATLAFYRRLGFKIVAEAGAVHVNVTLSDGMRLEFDSTPFVPQWDSDWKVS